MERIRALCFGLALSWLLLESIAQYIPDADHDVWTGNWNYTWDLGDQWLQNNTDVWKEFPNITEDELRSRQITFRTNQDGEETGCNPVPIYETGTLRVYQCTLRLPGFDAKSRICGDIPSSIEYACDWYDSDITLCHQWRDRYTQSLTFCTASEADACSDLDGRHMMCSCSIYYSWSAEQYFTFCDCKGSLNPGYDDSCAFSYFGLLETPDQGRRCQSICSRRSECKECNKDGFIPSAGVVTYCMCENIETMYGSQEICPCPDEVINNTACSDDYELFSGQCSEQSTNPMTSTPGSSNSTYWTPENRERPDTETFTTKDISSNTTGAADPSFNTSNTESTSQATEHKMTSILPRATDGVKTSLTTLPEVTTGRIWSTSTSPKQGDITYSSQTHTAHTSPVYTTKRRKGDRPPPNSRGMSDKAIAGIIFGVIGLIIILILILLILLVCLRLKNQGKRKASTSETTAHADEFTLLRNSNQIRPGSSVITYDNRSLATLAAEETCGSIYKDYFHVIEDGAGSNKESAYCFKVERTPNGSISGLEYQKQREKVFGSSGSIVPLLQSPGLPSPDMKGVCSMTNGQKTDSCDVSTDPESHYYFKLSDKKPTHINGNPEPKADVQLDYDDKDYAQVRKSKSKPGMTSQVSFEDNPYYFKVDPKNKNKNIRSNSQMPACTSQSPIALLSEQLTCSKNGAQTDESNDYQSLISKKKLNKVQSSTAKSGTETNSDYSYLLRPVSGQCDNEDYLSLRKMKTKLEEVPETPGDSHVDDDYFKLIKDEEKNYLKQCSSTSDTRSEYFSLLRTMASVDHVVEKDEDPYLQLQKKEGVVSVVEKDEEPYLQSQKKESVLSEGNENNKEHDYQLLKKKRNEEEKVSLPEVKVTDDDYQLLRKRSQKQSNLPDEGDGNEHDGNEHDYQLLKKGDNNNKESTKESSES